VCSGVGEGIAIRTAMRREGGSVEAAGVEDNAGVVAPVGVLGVDLATGGRVLSGIIGDAGEDDRNTLRHVVRTLEGIKPPSEFLFNGSLFCSSLATALPAGGVVAYATENGIMPSHSCISGLPPLPGGAAR